MKAKIQDFMVETGKQKYQVFPKDDYCSLRDILIDKLIIRGEESKSQKLFK